MLAWAIFFLMSRSFARNASPLGDFFLDVAQLRAKRLAAPAAGQPRGHSFDGFPRLEDLENLLEAEPADYKPPVGLLFQKTVGCELPENFPNGGTAHAVGFAELALDQPLAGRELLLDDLPPDIFVNRAFIHSAKIVYNQNPFVNYLLTYKIHLVLSQKSNQSSMDFDARPRSAIRFPTGRIKR